MGRRRRVRVPGSSANLGPGFDAMAAAVSAAPRAGGRGDGRVLGRRRRPGAAGRRDQPLRARRSPTCTRSTASRSGSRSEIPLAAGLGLERRGDRRRRCVAADHMYELALPREEIFERAARDRGPSRQRRRLALRRLRDLRGRPRDASLEPPSGLEAVAVIPREPVPTAAARAALPAEVPLADATFNVAHAATARARARARRPRADRARPRRPPAPAAPRATSTRARWSWSSARASSARSARRSRARARPCCSGSSSSRPARSSSACARRSAAGPRSGACNFVAQGADVAEL